MRSIEKLFNVASAALAVSMQHHVSSVHGAAEHSLACRNKTSIIHNMAEACMWIHGVNHLQLATTHLRNVRNSGRVNVPTVTSLIRPSRPAMAAAAEVPWSELPGWKAAAETACACAAMSAGDVAESTAGLPTAERAAVVEPDSSSRSGGVAAELPAVLPLPCRAAGRALPKDTEPDTCTQLYCECQHSGIGCRA